MDLSDIEALMGRDPNYQGPKEIAPFSGFLAPIGEVVIAFARLERRLTWAIESALRLRVEDANAIQESIYSVSTRVGLLFTVAAPHVSDNAEQRSELERLVKQLHKANEYRNFILHGPWTGVRFSSTDGKLERGAMKSKYAQLQEKTKQAKPREHSAEEMRAQARAMLNLCRDIQRWVLEVFPQAENRVP